MAKTSTNNIQNLDEDWGNDENVGLPFSGEAVQTFIKSYLRNVTAAAYFDPASYTMYFFASEEDRDSYINDPTSVQPTFSCQMNFSSILYRVNITNNTGATNINVATNAETLTLSTTFVVQSKAITDQEWTDLQTGCYVTILIDRNLSGVYVPLTERALYPAGSTISFDVFDELALGMNRVKFQFEAEDNSVTQALVYSVNLAELYVELWNNFWYLPILENDASSQRLGGFKIAGAGYKTLHFNVYNMAGTKVVDDIQVGIGTTNTYTTTPYYYQFPIDCPILGLETGAYTVEVYVDTPTMTSERIEYQIMFVETEDVNTAQLVCINSVADKIYNYANGTLCNYSVYNGGESYADLTATIQQKNGDTVVKTETKPLTDVSTAVSQDLSYEVMWPEITGDGYSIGFTITIGSTSVSGNVPIDNSTVFPPSPNYDFYMLASTRDNSESIKNKFINVVDDSELAATWTDIDFANGIDGWTMDDNGRKCLRIPAGTKVVLPSSSFNLLSGDNQTFEICYKAVNVANYDENIITLSPNPTVAGFQGVRIRPTNITVHSAQDLNANNDAKQGTNLCDDETVHFVLTVNPYFEGTNRLVTGYVNGCKNFMFTYTSASAWSGFNGALSIGSDKTDIFVYFIRHYPTALSAAGVQTNYISSLQTPQERANMDEKFASVLDPTGSEISYEAVKNNNFNFFVVKMVQGNGVPSASNGWGKKTEGSSVLEMHYGEHPEWDWRIGSTDVAVETMGQGTTSMNYYRWNIRWRIDKSNQEPADSNDKKKVPVQYVTARTRVGSSYQYTWGDASLAKTVRFDGTAHPPLMRITAKINMASSMQSHKIGATRAYTELHDQIGLSNEAQSAVSSGDPHPVVAVYEYPAFGFEYDAYNNIYNYIGLFTIGPDKGDKPTFGFDTTKNSLISLEGTDHSQPLARFAYPNLGGTAKGAVNYFYQEEGLSINLGSGSFLTGLEMGNCHGKEIDKSNKDNKASDDEPIIRGILDTEFWPAYELVWENSTLIFPVNPSTYGQSSVANTLAYINNHVTGETVADNFRLTPYIYPGESYSRLTYADMQFWIIGDNTYTLYYFDEAYGEYKPGISLATQNGTPTGSTADEKNNWFKEQRRARFMASAANYWDLDECIYHFVFCLIFGATDNFAKNSYPYKMATFANNGRWRWRQDDLDTIFDIDNSGRDSKPYHIEYEDANSGTAYFAGSNSVFWNLINECYWDDYNNGAGKGIRSIGQRVINAMVSLSGANNPYDGFVNYIGQCFWGNAQNYFPESAYNVDSYFKYELAWINNGQEVPPLEQALGNHYSGERLWVKRRAIYMLSLFHYGPFGDYSDRNLGRITIRPVAFSLELVPFLWMYPAAQVGQNTVVTGARTQAGASCPLSASVDSSGNTPAYIQATNYLASLGNLKDLRLGSNDASVLEVNAAKLITFLIGSTTEIVQTNIPGLKFMNTECLELIDARNAASIESIEGIEVCTRLRTLLLTGTAVSYVDIPSGSKIETLALPSGMRNIILLGLKHLSSFSMAGYSTVQQVRIEDTDIDVFAVVQNAYNNSSILEYIRVIWRGNLVPAAGVADMLYDMGTDPQYKGLAADGSTVLPQPYIEGTLDAHTIGMYTGDFAKLDIISEEDYQTNLKKALCGLFGTPLYVIYDPENVWISFVDATVESICVSHWDTSGDGKISIPEARVVTNLGSYFQGTAITSFDELQYFTGITSSINNLCNGCTSLVNAALPPNFPSRASGVFNGCTSLTTLTIVGVPTHSDYVFWTDAFKGCTNLKRLNIPSLEVWLRFKLAGGTYSTLALTPFSQSHEGHLYINGTEVVDLVIPNSITSISEVACFYFTGLRSVTFHNNLTTIGPAAFYGCSGLRGEIILPSSLTDTNLRNYAFYGCSGITSIVLPPSISACENNCLNGCSSLEQLTIGRDVNVNAANVFAGCTSLKRVNIPSLEAWFKCVQGTSAGARFFYNSGEGHLYMNGVEVTEVTVPSTITATNAYACQHCWGLISVNFASSVTSIGNASFEDCRSLTTVTIPSSVTSIGNYAFNADPALTTVSLSSGLLTIGTNAFQNCTSLASITLPSTLTSIGGSAFAGCTALKNLTIPATVTTLGTAICQNCTSLINFTYLGSALYSMGANQSNFGDGTGVFEVYGGLTRTGAGTLKFKKIIIHGNVNNNSLYYLSTWTGLEVIKIGGDLVGAPSKGAVNALMNTYGSASNLKYIEVGGTITGYPIQNGAGGQYIGDGCIFHLKYNGIACTPSQVELDRANTRVAMVYVDNQAILNQYLADADWSAYSAKLDLWSNYNGEYKNS